MLHALLAPLLALLAILSPLAHAQSGDATLPLEQWDALRDLAAPDQGPPPAPVPVLHLERSVDGAYQRGVFSGTLRATILVPEGQERGRVPVIGREVSVGQVLLDGRPTSLLLEGDSYTVAVAAPGIHRLELRFFQGREDDRFRRQLALALPPSGPTAVSVWLPETGVEATLAQGALVEVRPEGEGTRVQGQLDGRAQLDLSWKRQVQDQATVAALVEPEVDAVFTLQEALVQGVAKVTWRIREGEADRFELDLPPELEVLDVTGDAVLQWYTSAGPEASGSAGHLSVLTRYVVDDQASCAIHFQFPMDLQSALALRLPLPSLAPGGALRGHLGVMGPAGLGVTVQQAEGVTALDARDLPPSLLELAPRPLLLGWELQAPPQIALAVTRQADLTLTDTLIDDLQASTLLIEDGTEVGKLRLRLRNSTRQYLSVALPSGASLTHARIDGRPVRPAVSAGADGAELLLFPLQQSERLGADQSRLHVVADNETLSGIAALYDHRPTFWQEILDANRALLSSALDLEPGMVLLIPGSGSSPESSFIIELAYKRQQDALGVVGHRGLALPRVDVDVVRTTWHVYLPDALLPFGFVANLTATSNLRYDPITRLLYFLQDALSSRTAWAGEGGYQSILTRRRGLYKQEVQSRAMGGEVLSSFPFTGERYAFERLLPGQESARVSFLWMDRRGVPWVRWGALAAATALWLRLLRRSGWSARLGPALGLLGLLLVAQVVLGVHRRLLWGLDLALLWELYQRRWRGAWEVWKVEPPSLRAALRDLDLRHVAALGALGLACWLITFYPLLLSTALAAALLGARRGLARAAAPLLLAGVLLGGGARADDASDQDAAAEQQFETIMLKNLGYAGGDAPAAPRAAAPMASPEAPAPPAPPPVAPPGSTATVPLSRYEATRQAIQDRAADLDAARPVVLGSSIYTGAAQGSALALNLRLGVTLSGEGRWKMVPVIGEQVVIVRATAGGQPVPLTTDDGYHVWVTQQTGEVELSVDLLVPARGPRGSLEYDFLAPRTPVTRFSATFPVPGLEPRLRNTVSATIRSSATSTALEATLASTSRIHLVGYRDLGEDEARQARVYAESLSLLSLGEDAEELFTVFRYSILYAGARQFEILLPEGWTLVSAEAEGAFRHTVEPVEGGQLLRGETAFPIRNSFEISLRLRRPLPPSGERFSVPLPQGRGLERQYGWLAVEVNGNLKLEPGDAGGALPVDIRQLPYAIVESAVSPLLLAWRVLDPNTAVQLVATALPEKEPASGSVDRVEALSAISAEGTVLTELRITLRNRLRHALALRLPDGARVRTAFLDDAPVVPSQSPDGAVLFPLKRSDGGDRPEAFELVVVLESDGDAIGLLGWRTLALPALDLPISSLAWTLRLPGQNLYSRLYGDLAPQRYSGRGVWYQPASSGGDGGYGVNPGDGAGGAATPIRVEIPTGGTELRWAQYWIGADQPVTLTTLYLRRWLRAPLALGLFAGLVWILRRAWITGASRGAWAGAALLALALGKGSGAGAVVAAGALGLGLGMLVRPGLGAAARWALAWLRPPPPSPAQERSAVRRFLLICCLLAALGFLGLGLLGVLSRLLHPLVG